MTGHPSHGDNFRTLSRASKCGPELELARRILRQQGAPHSRLEWAARHLIANSMDWTDHVFARQTLSAIAADQARRRDRRARWIAAVLIVGAAIAVGLIAGKARANLEATLEQTGEARW
jgi:hypothetical protein